MLTFPVTKMAPARPLSRLQTPSHFPPQEVVWTYPLRCVSTERRLSSSASR